MAIVGAIVHGKVGARGNSVGGEPDHAEPSRAVGKRTLVEASATSPSPGGSVVQRKGSVEAPLEGAAVASIARRGTEGAGGQLPHHDRIQSLFGRHDISGVTAHEGPAASEASRSLGAQAYAASGPAVTLPKAGIDKAGFIDRKDGANLHTDPVQSTDRLVRDQPLPPATRVFVSGTHPRGGDWWYVTAFLPDSMVRGYVQGFRVNTQLPESLAELHLVADGETAEGLAKQQFSSAVSDGHDLRYYENVLLFVNQNRHPPGVRGAYQDPGVLGGGSNNVQLLAGELIWLVSAPYAKSLQSAVPSGSLTGGAVAKVKRFVGHIEDILRSVTESRHHFGEVAGEYAQAIRDHLPEIAGIVAAFIMAEATSAFLAATPTGVGQIAAMVIQLALAAFGAAGMVQAGIQAVKHAGAWLTIAWTANGKDEKLSGKEKQALRARKRELQEQLGQFDDAPAAADIPTPTRFKVRASGLTGKEAATDVPSWIESWPDARPGIDENGTIFATRMMNKKYGVGGWEKVGEHNTEFSQLKKWLSSWFSG